MMEHLTKQGESKLVETCSYPLTGIHCVARIYSDLAVIELHPDGRTPKVLKLCPGLTLDELSRLSDMTLSH
jgi:3-oxoadipate CoA-transferase, beta subunit